MITKEPSPLTHQDGNIDAEKSIFCCGEPIWPKGKHPFRAEFSMSCGWVIVDPDGRESTLGYTSQRQADDVAENTTYAYWQGAYRHGASRVAHAPGSDGEQFSGTGYGGERR